MAKNRIFTVGFELPGDEFEYIEFDSDKTLLDADIILYQPTLGDYSSYESYSGKPLLNEHSSFSVQQRLDHWKSEILAAVKAGKLVIIYLAKPHECYRYTGEKQHSGTGRSRITTNIVTQVSSYGAIPHLKTAVAKSGTEIQIDREAKYLVAYWDAFSNYSPYEVEIDGDFKHVLLRSRSGNRIIGASINLTAGALLFLPPLKYDSETFIRYDGRSKKSFWTEEALQFGKRLVSVLGPLVTNLNESEQTTPPPSWVSESQFRLESEGRLETEILARSSEIAALQTQKESLENELVKAGSLRRLLFEQGKPLEVAILEALRLLGFEAQSFSDGDSEFDSVFKSPEGRCLGEAEGKNNKAINIDKFSQLERNLQEDFSRDDVSEYAKGVLFGNAFRMQPLNERKDFFTDKCIAAAKRVSAALVRTPDLFLPARYLQENPKDTVYAKKCREAIFKANGDVVIFPAPPTDVENILDEKFGQ